MYLVAVMDWFSRYVVAWDLSNSMELGFCCALLTKALRSGRPRIFNTDQSSQLTSGEFTGILLETAIQISMDGRGQRWTIFSSSGSGGGRSTRTSTRATTGTGALRQRLSRHFLCYNHERPHSALENQPPESRNLEAGPCPAGRRSGAPPTSSPYGPILGGPLRLSQRLTR